ncbi:uncharacterized protein BCR38DRAFT_407698 [Pseudomassariella vexata]|uniref:Uncharacterized protein n=1 Tax=Pseudomassariella vexata TaxID=1141098 RepID=A0A1Y2E8K3_9PEZI|nr:uncharacterized protein BCR38DRAFT_407698 [Pseudomassariella vexata]ORY67757.1 hypothetical protein BCR38DRAFT_407698 [Pseudomassariella vexata]
MAPADDYRNTPQAALVMILMTSATILAPLSAILCFMIFCDNWCFGPERRRAAALTSWREQVSQRFFHNYGTNLEIDTHDYQPFEAEHDEEAVGQSRPPPYDIEVEEEDNHRNSSDSEPSSSSSSSSASNSGSG